MEEDRVIEVSEDELGFVRDILRTLTKAIKTLKVYPKDNPIFQKFSAELFENFNTFFESGDELALDVEQYSLLYKGKEVFRSEERTDNVAILLFADGIRQINFHKGITPEEITDFVDILRLAPMTAMSDDDDIVTLLWARNIKNMGYSAVEDTVDDDLIIEETLIQDDAGQTNTRETTISGSSFQWRPESHSSPLAIEPLSPGEIESVKHELSEVDEKSLLSSAVGLFFELLSDEDNSDAFPGIAQSLGKIVDIRMQRKEIAGAIEILEGLDTLYSLRRFPEQREIINSVTARAGSIENIRILFRESSSSEEIYRYLLLLKEDFIPQMVEILGELEDRKQRRLLCEILAELGRQNVNVFAEALGDARWYLVRNIVMILGMIKEPGAVRHIERVLGHSELRVRREAVRALDGIHTEETKKIFLAVLKDSDLTVRIIALKALRRFRDDDLFQTLKEKATREELRLKPFAEKKEMLETLAAVGGERALPLLSDLFRKRGLIEKDEITGLRASAAYGLGVIGTPEALSLLEKETGSRKAIIREACTKALKESPEWKH